ARRGYHDPGLSRQSFRQGGSERLITRDPSSDHRRRPPALGDGPRGLFDEHLDDGVLKVTREIRPVPSQVGAGAHRTEYRRLEPAEGKIVAVAQQRARQGETSRAGFLRWALERRARGVGKSA